MSESCQLQEWINTFLHQKNLFVYPNIETDKNWILKISNAADNLQVRGVHQPICRKKSWTSVQQTYYRAEDRIINIYYRCGLQSWLNSYLNYDAIDKLVIKRSELCSIIPTQSYNWKQQSYSIWNFHLHLFCSGSAATLSINNSWQRSIRKEGLLWVRRGRGHGFQQQGTVFSMAESLVCIKMWTGCTEDVVEDRRHTKTQ